MAKARILVVAKEGQIAEDIRAGLSDLAYELVVSSFADEEAITQAETAMPDLVFVDVILGRDLRVMSAAGDLAQRLRIPIIFSPFRTEEGILEQLAGAGLFGYLIKPFQPAGLVSAVEAALLMDRPEAAPPSADKDPELDSSYIEKRVRERTKDLESSTAELKNYGGAGENQRGLEGNHTGR